MFRQSTLYTDFWDQAWFQNLGIDLDMLSVHMHGQSGLHVNQLDDCHWIVANFSPRVVMLEIGSNDIPCQDSSQLARQIIDQANKLLEWHSLQMVIINRILYRTRTKHCNIQHYNQQVDEVNTALQALLLQNKDPRVCFYKHPRLTDRVLDSALSDGIHFSDDNMSLYQHSLRNKILDTAKILQWGA